MKLGHRAENQTGGRVASRAEAWIETSNFGFYTTDNEVASRAEAWIETTVAGLVSALGLVASRAEAWIETRPHHRHIPSKIRRLPCGGVD